MKLRTKLVLGVTLVAGLSVSAFAACAANVDFGGTKKITGLADGTATGEAVHYGQVLKVTSADITFNDANITSWGGQWTPKVVKSGNMVCVSGIIRDNTGTPTSVVVGTIPEGMYPLNDTQLSYTLYSTNDYGGRIIFYKNGDVYLDTVGQINTHNQISGCWIAQ